MSISRIAVTTFSIGALVFASATSAMAQPNLSDSAKTETAVSLLGNKTPKTDQQIVDDSSASVDMRVAAQLRISPGGTRISYNEVSWKNGQVIISFPSEGKSSAPVSSRLALGDTTRKTESTSEQQRIIPGRSPGYSTQSIEGCPTQITGNDYYCFYADQDWKGRRLQFKDTPQNIYFGDWGFPEQTSAWVNGGGATITVKDRNGSFLWTEFDHAKVSYVGKANNDRAMYAVVSSS